MHRRGLANYSCKLTPLRMRRVAVMKEQADDPTLLPPGRPRSSEAPDASASVGASMFPDLADRKMWYCLDRHKPTWRGKLHKWCALSSPVWVYYQLSLCSDWPSAIGASLALFAALFLFSASSSFHLGRWTQPQERWAMKVDYIAIFLQVGFSFAPLFVQLLRPATSYVILALLAAAVAAGAWLTLAEVNLGRHAVVFTYMAMAGVQLVPLSTHLLSHRSAFEAMLPAETLMFFGMAACYVVGSQVYAHAAPPLWPDHFGYHELWHLLVSVASFLSYACNCSVLMRCTADQPCYK